MDVTPTCERSELLWVEVLENDQIHTNGQDELHGRSRGCITSHARSTCSGGCAFVKAVDSIPCQLLT